MDIRRLDVLVDDFEPSNDGRTFLYKVSVSYGALTWAVWRRFSEFHKLHNDLFADGYAGLPAIPGKSLMRPNDPESGRKRMLSLNRYLRESMARPDLRMSPALINFLEIEVNTSCIMSSARPLHLGSVCHDVRFSPVDMAFHQSILATAHMDCTPLAKFGKAWALVEPEDTGAMTASIFPPQIPQDGPLAAKFLQRYAPLRITTCCIVPGMVPLILYGNENGEVMVLAVEPEPQESAAPNLKASALMTLEMFFKAKIIAMEYHEIGGSSQAEADQEPIGPRDPLSSQFAACRSGVGVVVSIGSDNGLRVISAPVYGSTNTVLLSGGRVIKPLDKDENLSCFCMDGAQIILGTTMGKLLVYEISVHPPRLTKTLDLYDIIASLEGRPTRKELQQIRLDSPEGDGPFRADSRLTDVLALTPSGPSAVGYESRSEGPRPKLHVRKLLLVDENLLVVAVNSALFGLPKSFVGPDGAVGQLSPAQQSGAGKQSSLGPQSVDRESGGLGQRSLICENQPWTLNDETSILKADETPYDGPEAAELPWKLACPLEAAADVTAMTVMASTGILCVAYHRSLAFYNLRTLDLLQCFEDFMWGKVSKLMFFSQSTLAVCSSHKGISLFDLSTAHTWQIWRPGAAVKRSKVTTPATTPKAAAKEAPAVEQEDFRDEILGVFTSAKFERVLSPL